MTMNCVLMLALLFMGLVTHIVSAVCQSPTRPEPPEPFDMDKIPELKSLFQQLEYFSLNETQYSSPGPLSPPSQRLRDKAAVALINYFVEHNTPSGIQLLSTWLSHPPHPLVDRLLITMFPSYMVARYPSSYPLKILPMHSIVNIEPNAYFILTQIYEGRVDLALTMYHWGVNNLMRFRHRCRLAEDVSDSLYDFDLLRAGIYIDSAQVVKAVMDDKRTYPLLPLALFSSYFIAIRFNRHHAAQALEGLFKCSEVTLSYRPVNMNDAVYDEDMLLQQTCTEMKKWYQQLEPKEEISVETLKQVKIPLPSGKSMSDHTEENTNPLEVMQYIPQYYLGIPDGKDLSTLDYERDMQLTVTDPQEYGMEQASFALDHFHPQP
ncbi:hypothetical protein IWQ62_000335 [Dispira parvispora]|uniref:Uncharacterized protein n=1 Tax=Dispira parvispora TaxID=1520584 RepID=A0A9W8AUY7_9FUNG|nr:hypothetical protein IWQ62_000335 [Dispira parvispora]